VCQANALFPLFPSVSFRAVHPYLLLQKGSDKFLQLQYLCYMHFSDSDHSAMKEIPAFLLENDAQVFLYKA